MVFTLPQSVVLTLTLTLTLLNLTLNIILNLSLTLTLTQVQIELAAMEGFEQLRGEHESKTRLLKDSILRQKRYFVAVICHTSLSLFYSFYVSCAYVLWIESIRT
jgi:hypothetical protein